MHYKREFTIGYKEIRDRNRYQTLAKGPKGHPGLLGMAGLALAAALVVLLYMPEHLRNTPVTKWGTFAFAFAAAFLLFIFFGILRSDIQTKNAVNKQRQQSYRQEIAIDAFGVHVTVNKKTADVGYDKLVRVEETKKAFYVYITPSDGWILPKEQMENAPEESRTIRTLFNTVMMSKDLRLQKD